MAVGVSSQQSMLEFYGVDVTARNSVSLNDWYKLLIQLGENYEYGTKKRVQTLDLTQYFSFQSELLSQQLFQLVEIADHSEPDFTSNLIVFSNFETLDILREIYAAITTGPNAVERNRILELDLERGLEGISNPLEQANQLRKLLFELQKFLYEVLSENEEEKEDRPQLRELGNKLPTTDSKVIHFGLQALRLFHTQEDIQEQIAEKEVTNNFNARKNRAFLVTALHQFYLERFGLSLNRLDKLSRHQLDSIFDQQVAAVLATNQLLEATERLQVLREVVNRLNQDPYFLDLLYKSYVDLTSQIELDNKQEQQLDKFVAQLSLGKLLDDQTKQLDKLENKYQQESESLTEFETDFAGRAGDTKYLIDILQQKSILPGDAQLIIDTVDRLILSKTSPYFFYSLSTFSFNQFFRVEISEELLIELRPWLYEIMIARRAHFEVEYNLSLSRNIPNYSPAQAVQDRKNSEKKQVISQDSYPSVVLNNVVVLQSLESSDEDNYADTEDVRNALLFRQQQQKEALYEQIRNQFIEQFIQEQIVKNQIKAGLVALEREAYKAQLQASNQIIAQINFQILIDQMARQSQYQAAAINQHLMASQESQAQLANGVPAGFGDESEQPKRANWLKRAGRAARYAQLARKAKALSKTAKTALQSVKLAKRISSALAVIKALIASLIQMAAAILSGIAAAAAAMIAAIAALGFGPALALAAAIVGAGVAVSSALSQAAASGSVSGASVTNATPGSQLPAGSETTQLSGVGTGTTQATTSLSGGGGLAASQATALTVSGTGIVAAMVVSSTIGAFQHPYQTLTGDQESPYVTISKLVEGETSIQNSQLPYTARYIIEITAKPEYDLYISSITDTFDISINQETRPDATIPTLPTRTKNELIPDTSQVQSTSPEAGFLDDGSIFIPAGASIQLQPYDQVLSDQFADSNVLNSLVIQFRALAISDDTEEESTARTTQVLCVGECPQLGEGCWPTSGIVKQGPYGSFSHQSTDSFDIAAPIGQEITAMATGSVCKLGTNSANIPFDPTNLTCTTNAAYGLSLRLTAGSNVFIYGHLSAVEGNIPSCGQGSTAVQIGEVLGYVGNSGCSTGPHLDLTLASPKTPPTSILATLLADGPTALAYTQRNDFNYTVSPAAVCSAN